MDSLMVVMRLVHIFSGVFWVGVTLFMVSFLEPTIEATGEAGKKFMQHLSTRTRFSSAMAVVAVLTVVSGFIMYWRLSGFRLGWVSSGYGLFLTIGSIAGIIAFFSGFLIQSRSINQLKVVGAQIQASGGPPSAEQIDEMSVLSERISKGGVISAILMSIALVGMSLAQYIVI